MANKYWRGGSGSWTDTAHWSDDGVTTPAAVPVSSDDVIFDSSSGGGVCNLTGGATIQTLNMSGTATALGLSSILRVGTAFIDALGWSGGAAFEIAGSSSTLTTNGFILPPLSLLSGSLTFGDACSASSFSAASGTSAFFGSFTHSFGDFTMAIATSRTLTASGSITISGNYSISGVGSITMTGSSITMTGVSVSFSHNGPTGSYNNVVLAGSGGNITIASTATITSLTCTGSAFPQHVVKLGGNITANAFTANGAGATNRILILSSVIGTQRTITTSGTATGSYVDFMDVRFSTTKNFSSVTGGSGDCGGNANITFTTSATQNWTNVNGGDWSNPSNWSSRVPLPQDDVTFSCAFGSGKTVNFDMARSGRNIDLTAATFTGTKPIFRLENVVFNATRWIFGSFMGSTQFTFNANSNSFVLRGRSSSVFTTAGFQFYDLSFITCGGVVTQADAISCSHSFNIDGGSFAGNSANVSSPTFLVRSIAGITSVISMGTGTWTANGTSGTVWEADGSVGTLSFSGTGATLQFSGSGSSAKTFIGGGLSYGAVVVATDNLSVTGSNSFIAFAANVAGMTNGIKFAASSIQTFPSANFTTNGSSGNLAKISASSSVMTFYSPSGYVGVNYMSITNVRATGGASWYGGFNSTYSGDTTGWLQNTLFSISKTFSTSASLAKTLAPGPEGVLAFAWSPSAGWESKGMIVDVGASFTEGRETVGTAEVSLFVPASSDYEIAEGTSFLLCDGPGWIVFAGIVRAYSLTWIGRKGDRKIAVSLSSLETYLAGLLISPRAYNGMTGGEVFTDLFNTVAVGMPIYLGDVEDGAVVSRRYSYDYLGEAFASIATELGKVYFLDARTQTVHLVDLTSAPAEFELIEQIEEDTIQLTVTREDRRTKHVGRGNWDAFVASAALFVGNGEQTSFELPYLADHIVSARTTTAARATATGTFATVPASGDSVTINTMRYEFVTSLDNRQICQVLIGATVEECRDNLIDAINVENAARGTKYSLPTWENDLVNARVGTSGSPAVETTNTFVVFAKIPGTQNSEIPLSSDNSSISWSSGGSGPGPVPVAWAEFGGFPPVDGSTVTIGGITYTFRNTINNANPNEVWLGQQIGGSYALYPPWSIQALWNLRDAINGVDAYYYNENVSWQFGRGFGYSTPTTANPDAVASSFQSVSPALDGEAVGASFLLSSSTGTPTLSESEVSGNHFAWRPISTSATGGTDGTETDLSVSTSETDRADVRFFSETNRIEFDTAPALGDSVLVLYHRLGADCIAVENSDLVAERALIEGSSGKLEMFSDETDALTRTVLLARVQAALAKYEEDLLEVNFSTRRPGLLPGRNLVINLPTTGHSPVGAPSRINGSWLLDGVSGSWSQGTRSFVYSVSCKSRRQEPFVRVWERLLGASFAS